jgi:cytochrome c oxidase subunit 4
MSNADAHGRMSHGEPQEAHGTTAPTPHHKVHYVFIFLMLVVLTIITVGVYFLHPRSETVKVLLALTIASIKAGLVATFFMHLKFEGKLIYTIAIVPLVLCVLLVCALIPDILNGHLFNGHFPQAEAAIVAEGHGATAPASEIAPSH